MRPTVIVLVRHGATPTTGTVLPGRARGLHLSDVGRAQAEATAAALSAALKLPPSSSGKKSPPPRVSAVYSSPMERARETAAPIAAALDLTVTVEPALIECDFGEWTGKELKALAKLPAWRQVQSDPSGFRFPDGESFPEMGARILGALQEIRARHPGEIAVAVSHADPIKVALADALGAHIGSIHRLWVATASVSAIAYSETGPAVLAINATGDLSLTGAG